jgi:hypothetical protein
MNKIEKILMLKCKIYNNLMIIFSITSRKTKLYRITITIKTEMISISKI